MHRSTRNHASRLFFLAAGMAMLLASIAISAQERTTLRKVEIRGLQRQSPDQVIAASGLKVGEPIDALMIDAAASKLMRSGWFQSVDYRVRTADGDTTVVFEVVEKVAALNASAAETLGRVVWIGNSVLSSEALTAAFGLRAGDPVPQTKIDEGLGRILKAYARSGHINAEITDVTRNLDDRRANFEFTIREGQQYRMGLLSITGLGPADTGQLKSRWTLAPNAIFDDSYLDQFRTAILRPFVASRAQRTGIRSRFEISTKPDTQKLTVDVLIAFK